MVRLIAQKGGCLMQRTYIDIESPESLRVRTDTPPQPGPGEVLIDVHYAGVNRADLLQRVGLYPVPADASPIMGLEVAGTVIANGTGSEGLLPGRRVCALVAGGGYATHAIARVDHCLAVPDNISLVEAAALPEALLTVWHNVVVLGQLRADQTALIHGGSSGIGSLGIQMAKLLGAKVLTTAGGPDKCAKVAALGADAVFDYRADPLLAQIEAAGYAGAIDVILDMAGGDFTQLNLDLAAPDGRIVCIGMMRGLKAEINLFTILQKRLHLTGSTLRGMGLDEKVAAFVAIRQHMLGYIAGGRIKPVIHAQFPLEDAMAAHHAMQAGAHVGKLVLNCQV